MLGPSICIWEEKEIIDYQSWKGPVWTTVPPENLKPCPSAFLRSAPSFQGWIHNLLASCIPNPPATFDMTKHAPSQASHILSPGTGNLIHWSVSVGIFTQEDSFFWIACWVEARLERRIWETWTSFQRETAQGGGPCEEDGKKHPPRYKTSFASLL